MKQVTYNPYEHLGVQFKEGLNYIINNLPSPIEETKFNKLNEILVAYMASIMNEEESEPSNKLPPIIDNLVYSVLPNAANSYQNNNLINESFYNETQLLIINGLISAIKNNSVEGIKSILCDTNEEIAQSGLSSADQAPLYVATVIGEKSFEYWSEQIEDNESPWGVFFNSNYAINHANLPYWVIASIESSLAGYTQIQQVDMITATALNSIGRAVGSTAAMLAAVGVSSGKLLFKWVQKLNFNPIDISTISNDFGDVRAIDISGSKRPRCCMPKPSTVGISCKGPDPRCIPNI